MKVLLVDDDAVTRMMVATQLKRLGHEVTTACDGREALRSLAVVEAVYAAAARGGVAVA